MNGFVRIGAKALLSLSLALIAVPTPDARALGSFDIVINAGSALQANPDALAAFNRAAARWEAFIADPITVNISADLGNLGNSNIIGQASSALMIMNYDTVRNALVADASNELSDVFGFDDTITQSLPTAAGFSAVLPVGASLSGNISINTAAAKALGFSFGGFSDAIITFNTQFSFDYDNSNGVGAGLTDFETVAIHEIGHALGFTSVVDQINSGTTFVSPRPLDLYRFANGGPNDPSSVSDFSTFTRNLTPGVEVNTDIITDAWRMSTGLIGTGLIGGDGRQASHWKDGSLTSNTIGVMDPTLGAQEVFPITIADLRALDLIGYEIFGVLAGDYDNSGAVGQGDLALVLQFWGAPVADGQAPVLAWANMLTTTAPLIGQDELALVLQHWGDTTAILAQLSAITSVTGLTEQKVLQLIPEPGTATLVLAVCGLATLTRRGRNRERVT